MSMPVALISPIQVTWSPVSSKLSVAQFIDSVRVWFVLEPLRLLSATDSIASGRYTWVGVWSANEYLRKPAKFTNALWSLDAKFLSLLTSLVGFRSVGSHLALTREVRYKCRKEIPYACRYTWTKGPETTQEHVATFHMEYLEFELNGPVEEYRFSPMEDSCEWELLTRINEDLFQSKRSPWERERERQLNFSAQILLSTWLRQNI